MLSRIILPLLFVAVIISLIYYFISSQNTKSTELANVQQQSTNEIVIETDCNNQPIVVLTEGPYYKADSPKRQKIAKEGTPGIRLILKGYVVDTNCNPISNAWLDFWQADGDGEYDNTGYNLRGHQFTANNGFFRIETVLPAEYGNRTPHIHFKVRKPESDKIMTSQLYFPDAEQNTTDSLFDESMTVNMVTEKDGSKFADYTIVLPD